MNMDCTGCRHAAPTDRPNGVSLINPDSPTHLCLESPPQALLIPHSGGYAVAFTYPQVGRSSVRCSRYEARHAVA